MLSPPMIRRSMDQQAVLLMVLFCLLLGLQQVMIKSIADDMPPLSQMVVRCGLALPLMMLLAWRQGVCWAQYRQHWAAGLWVGLGFTGEFAFLAWGLEYSLASHMSVFLYTAPIFAALGLHFLVPGEQLTRRQWIGILCAFIGMLVAMAPSADIPNIHHVLLGDALGLCAGLSWAATTLVLRRTSLNQTPPSQIIAYQLAVLVLLLGPVVYGLGQWQQIMITPAVVMSLSFQTLVISFAALLLWFALLARYKASQLGAFSFLSPLFGVIFGVIWLDEPLSWNFIAGGLAILMGVFCVSRG